MCGIVGVWSTDLNQSIDMESVVQSMSEAINYRGPDDSGVWNDREAGVTLGHRRLAILDLTVSGHQPMRSNDKTRCLVFNGEIYNHLEIREQLADFLNIKGYQWKGTSDTETLLIALEAWGIEKTLQAISGMFAFALWDSQNKKLSLARDRMGEKPLYYGLQKGHFIFSSELKALRQYKKFSFNLNNQALCSYLQYNYVASPFSIYENVYKLIPGTWIDIDISTVDNGNNILPKPYWSLRDVIERQSTKKQVKSSEFIIDQLDKELDQAVSKQMISDVSLGGLLSGGIDSSLIVALMQKNSSNPVKTFTIGFDDPRYNEAKYAKEIAQYLGTNHSELYVSESQMLDTVSMLPQLYDEPFSDASQIPTFLVCQLAKESVTVSLSGDGGDELFGGYNRYVSAVSIWRKVKNLPYSIRAAIAGMLINIPPERWDKAFSRLEVFIPKKWRYKTLGDKLHKAARVLASYSSDEIYQEIVSHWQPSSGVVLGMGKEVNKLVSMPSIQELELQMMYMDSITYLPDDILTKVDRAAMGCSLETRVPFLDPKVIEFAWEIPLSMKIKDSQGKWVLKQVLNKYIPNELIDRPKNGFSVPIVSWLNGPLKPIVLDLLSTSRLQRQELFNPNIVCKIVTDFYKGHSQHAHKIWSMLIYQMWHDEYMGISDRLSY